MKRKKYYSLLRLLYECLKVLRRAINWLFLRHDRLPHDKLAPLEQLQDRLGYVYLCVQTKNACISRWRRYVFAPPRGDRRDECICTDCGIAMEPPSSSDWWGKLAAGVRWEAEAESRIMTLDLIGLSKEVGG